MGVSARPKWRGRGFLIMKSFRSIQDFREVVMSCSSQAGAKKGKSQPRVLWMVVER